MTPYEASLERKLSKAVELSSTLSAWCQRVGFGASAEEAILVKLIQQIDSTNRLFEDQLQRYEALAEKRQRMAEASESGLKLLTRHLWEDAGYQFRTGTVANDLLKILCQKILRFALPAFPVSRRAPLLCKTVRLYEDSYDLLGQYFSWLIDLLEVVRFAPVRPPYRLAELRDWARQYHTLSVQIRQEAELLRNHQLTKDQLYKQLNQTMRTAKGRLLIYKRDSRQMAAQVIQP
ncbi:hypothetical protein [Spirosoma koreense]